MIDPIYNATLTVGGSNHSYAFVALPKILLAEQSMDLSITIENADGSPYDLGSATAEFFCTGLNISGILPTPLGTATISDSGQGVNDTVSIVVEKNEIPEFLGNSLQTRTGNSVFYFQIQDVDSYIQIYQYVNVIDSNFDGDGSGNVELPSSSLIYNPADDTNWIDPDPVNVEEGLDQLADRVKGIEDLGLSKNLTISDSTGAYSLTSAETGNLIKIDGDLEIPVLTEENNFFIYNKSSSAVNIINTGTTIDNTTDTKISAKGFSKIVYIEDNTVVIVDGTEP
jgi:hypothetical protein